MNLFKSMMICDKLEKRLEKDENLAIDFHLASKHGKRLILPNMYRSRNVVNNSNFRETISLPEKSYPLARKIKLNGHSEKSTLNSILDQRTSRVQQAVEYQLSANDLAELCWGCYGTNRYGRRTIPSAGALYPLEVYVFSINTEIGKGVFHYRPSTHTLEQISELPDLEQYMIVTKGFELSSAVFIITGIFNRMMFKYDIRGYRYVLLEAGAAAQNLSLKATELDFIATWMGGTADVVIEKILGINGVDESIVNGVMVTKTSLEKADANKYSFK